MKPVHFSRFGRRTIWTLGASLLFVSQAAQACPGCKQNTDGANAVPLNGDSIGFGLSIFFMLFMIVAVLGGLGYMMFRSCRVLAARDAQALAEDSGAEEIIAPSGRVAEVMPASGAWVSGLAHGRA